MENWSDAFQLLDTRFMRCAIFDLKHPTDDREAMTVFIRAGRPNKRSAFVCVHLRLIKSSM